MSGALQATFMNQRSFGLTIGQAYEGGFFAGQISTAGNSIADYNIVVGPVASAQSNLQFKTANTGGDPSSDIDGPANSAAMNNAAHPAAQFCEGLTIGGFTDWYMPAKNELDVCYYGLKPGTEDNNASVGTNANSVPRRNSNYTTTGAPLQTSATNFRTGGAEAYSSNQYWTSTSASSVYAYRQIFYAGSGGYSYKTNSKNTRAIRRVAV